MSSKLVFWHNTNFSCHFPCEESYTYWEGGLMSPVPPPPSDHATLLFLIIIKVMSRQRRARIQRLSERKRSMIAYDRSFVLSRPLTVTLILKWRVNSNSLSFLVWEVETNKTNFNLPPRIQDLFQGGGGTRLGFGFSYVPPCPPHPPPPPKST